MNVRAGLWGFALLLVGVAAGRVTLAELPVVTVETDRGQHQAEPSAVPSVANVPPVIFKFRFPIADQGT